MERINNDKFLLSATAISCVALGVLATLGVQGVSGPSNADKSIAAFESKFTDKGKCLHGTQFDPAGGANISVHTDRASGEDILSVVPEAANFSKPPVLFLNHDAVKMTFVFADTATAAYLEITGCPDLPNGS